MIFEFRIQLKDVKKPPVWRRIQVPAAWSFYNFHEVIQEAFGWEHAHLFRFEKGLRVIDELIIEPAENMDGEEPDGNNWMDADETTLKSVFKAEGDVMLYLYDFGDGWQHSIKLERILPGNSGTPCLIDGKGACPPEDCGGPWGYEHLKTILQDKEHPETAGYKAWLELGPEDTWDPRVFDLEAARQRVADLQD